MHIGNIYKFFLKLQGIRYGGGYNCTEYLLL